MSKEKSLPEMPAEKKSVQTAGPEQLMYTGPTLLTPIILKHRSIFTGGRPKFLDGLEKEVREALDKCFITLDKAGAALRELEGGREAGDHTRNYKNIKKIIGSKK